jgi:hypothetical protein
MELLLHMLAVLAVTASASGAGTSPTAAVQEHR